MKRNEEFETECVDLSNQGYGVCRHRGEVVFVPNLLPKEKARVKIIYPASKFSIGKVMERYTDSDERIVPVCQKADQCGGCMLQHVRYDDQKKWKAKWLKQLFKGHEVADVAGHAPYDYRNKAQFPARLKDGKLISGFYRPHSHDIVDTDDCVIQEGEINAIHDFIKKNISADEAEGLRHIFIRNSRMKEEAQVVFIGEKNHFERITEKLVKTFPVVKSVVFNENTRADNVILGEKHEVLYGRDYIYEDCLGLTVELHFKSFFQVDPEMTKVLYGKALELADLKDTDEVIDLYSGTGTIGMLAARSAKHVTGIEIVPEAVENARRNAKLNDIENIDFQCADASKFAAEFSGHVDVLFVDPPRKGLSEQGIADIVRIAPEKVVYVSCNPKTLKRDLDRFEAQGYRAGVIHPVDMFAQTAGIECVTCLTR